MNLVHYDLVWIYLICWLSEFLHDIVVFLIDVKDAVKSTCQKSKDNRKKDKNKSILKDTGENKEKKSKTMK